MKQGTEGKGKKVVAGRKAPRAATPPKKRPLRLEVGKRYVAENGDIAKCIKFDSESAGVLPYKVMWLTGEAKGLCLWTYKDGRYWRTRPGFDLVREVPSAKRGGAKRSRPKASPRNPSVTPRTRRAEA